MGWLSWHTKRNVEGYRWTWGYVLHRPEVGYYGVVTFAGEPRTVGVFDTARRARAAVEDEIASFIVDGDYEGVLTR